MDSDLIAGGNGGIMRLYISHILRRPVIQSGEKYCTIFSVNLVYL
jgi:hypothetical protein